MLRVLEPELMLDVEQAIAYAEADFSSSDDQFVQRFKALFGTQLTGKVMDLGCGPGNITFRMAAAFPDSAVIGVEGSLAMLDIALARNRDFSAVESDIQFIQTTIPSSALPNTGAISAVVSNSLLHHLHDPAVLWQTLKQVAAPGAMVLVADLCRPKTADAAREIVETYAGDAPEILRIDFYNSLLAAFEVNEVAEQLDIAGLHELQVAPVNDRYLEVYGHMPD